MPIRRNPVDEARRHARRQLDDLIRDLRDARHAAGLSQRRVAAAMGVSPQLVSWWESGGGTPDQVQAAAWGATLGLDVPVRSFLAGSPLRDAPQLRVLARCRPFLGNQWRWDTEVRVSPDPRDRRAVDAVLERDGMSIGVEVISRLTDAQAQVRAAIQKRDAADLDRMLLILGNTRYNRAAVRAAQPTLGPTFPVLGRAALRTIRHGYLPPIDGLAFV